MTKNHRKQFAKLAFRFVLIIGIVNLFADMAYEGGRSITGPFLGSLGASATIVGFVAGLGELLMPVTKRSTRFGLFYTGYGIAWFLGSAAMGFLYDKSITTLIIFSLFCQLLALPVLFWGKTESRGAVA
jgi:predicted MFS family arabinose efflux permease